MAGSDSRCADRPHRIPDFPLKPVFLDYDQKALDDAYDQAAYAANREQVTQRWRTNSDLARARLGEPERLAYGPAANERLDFFRARKPGSSGHAPANIFIHGGAWRAGLAANYAHAAEPFIRAGAHFVVLDFDNVGDTGGELMPMADQVRRAVAWVHANAERLGVDAERVFVSGASSGAHLGGVVAITDWVTQFGLPQDCVKGYVLCSGMYDLRAPRLSKRSAYVNFTDQVEEQLSPQRHVGRIAAPIVVLYGSHDTPEFQRQSREFAATLAAAGKTVELVFAQGYNHFELQETIGNPYGPVGRAVLAQMGLA